MASQVGQRDRDLIEELKAEGFSFDFFQAVRLLEQHIAATGDAEQDLRFATSLALAFPAAEIDSIRCLVREEAAYADSSATADGADDSTSDRRWLMTVSFMGLVGSSGVLPLSYTELLLERRHRYRDRAAHDFLDMFCHRALSLFYQAWRKHHFWIGVESGADDIVGNALLALAGAGFADRRSSSEPEQSEDRLAPATLRYYAGMLAQKPMSVANLCQLIGDYFEVQAAIDCFAGRWIAIPPHEQTALGKQLCNLGCAAILGGRSWDRQTGIRLRLGPLDRRRFNDFLPGGAGAQALCELLRLCIGESFAVELVLTASRTGIGPLRLQPDRNGMSARLGCDAWLLARMPRHDLQDTRFLLMR